MFLIFTNTKNRCFYIFFKGYSKVRLLVLSCLLLFSGVAKKYVHI